MKGSLLTAIATAALAITTGVEAANVQKKGLKLPASAAANAKKAKDAFSQAFATYKAKAWGHDDLAPVSGSYV